MTYIYDVEKSVGLKLTDVNNLSLNVNGDFDFELTNPHYQLTELKSEKLVDIPTENLALWLRADKGIIIDSSSGIDTVAQWQDGSGNNRHVSQPVKTNQPLLENNTINRLKGLYFQGGEQALVGNWNHNQDKLCVFIVAKKRDFSFTYAGYFSVFGSHYQDYDNSDSGAILLNLYGGLIGGYRGNQASCLNHPPLNIPFLAASRWDGINHALQINNDLGDPVVSNSNFNFTNFTIGSRYENGITKTSVDAEIAEVIAYGDSLSNANYNKVISYLKSKYNL